MTKATLPSRDRVRAQLLAWYDRQRRDLPWRARPGEAPDPYRVWLSEIMLQQTTVAAVKDYFEDFTARWPTVADLAAAPNEVVMARWAGLGYYARARNLHLCAQAVAEELGGRFPDTEAELRELPGIGPYTAAAIAAIAFDQPAAPIDGNCLFAVTDEFPAAKKEVKTLAESLVTPHRPGDFAQAVMDLGATICLPKIPKCLLCPLSDLCRAQAQGLEAELPRAAPRKAKPTRRGVAFWIVDRNKRVFLRRRPPRGLLGGMMEVPSTDWRSQAWSGKQAEAQAPLEATWQTLPGQVTHTFTHFHLELGVWRAVDLDGNTADGEWIDLNALGEAGLPSVMMKIARHAMKAE